MPSKSRNSSPRKARARHCWCSWIPFSQAMSNLQPRRQRTRGACPLCRRPRSELNWSRTYRALASLSIREQSHYLGIRFRARFHAMIGYRVGQFIKRWVCALYLRLGWVLPPFVRSVYILDIYQRALRQYVPKALSGRVVYFKTARRSASHQARWTSVLRDGVEAYEVPGNHIEVIQKGNLGAWTERLASCISQAQRQVESPQRPRSLRTRPAAGPLVEDTPSAGTDSFRLHRNKSLL